MSKEIEFTRAGVKTVVDPVSREAFVMPVTLATSKDEAAIESEIHRKGLNAPRLTPDHIDAQILDEAFHVFPGTTLTVCALTLRNGFMVTGESAAASPENFDEEIGRKIARDNARNKIWAFEGYLLRERLHARDSSASKT